jgi:hypothetical protein
LMMLITYIKMLIDYKCMLNIGGKPMILTT